MTCTQEMANLRTNEVKFYLNDLHIDNDKLGKHLIIIILKKLAHRQWQIEFPGVPRHDEQEKCETI